MSTGTFRFFCQPPTVYGSSTPYGNNTSIGKFVQSDDAKLYYEVYGEGSPLLVLHGGGVGSPYEMGQLIDNFRKSFQVIVMWTRGHGRSEMGHQKLSYASRGKDILAVLTAVTDKAAILVGFSDGAFSAFKFASMYPDKVDRIVAIGAGTLRAGFFDSDMKVEDLEKIDKTYVDQMRELSPEPERLQEFFTSYMGFFHELSVGEEVFRAIKCPTLLIVGDEDDHAPVQTVVDAHKMLANSRLCVVPKAWHPAFLDNYPVVWSAIEPFLSLSPSSSITGSAKPSELNAKDIESEDLLITGSSWDGASLPAYPSSTPQLRTRRFVIPPGATLSPHTHPMMSAGVVLRGALTLIRNDNTEHTFTKGQSFAETVGTIHKGVNRTTEPIELIVFYVWTEGTPLSVPAQWE